MYLFYNYIIFLYSDELKHFVVENFLPLIIKEKITFVYTLIDTYIYTKLKLISVLLVKAIVYRNKGRIASLTHYLRVLLCVPSTGKKK